MNRTVLILGGVGLVGDAIVRRLQTSSFPGFRVVVIDRRPHPQPLEGVEYLTGLEVDVFNPAFMAGMIQRFEPVAVIDSVNIATLSSKQGDITNPGDIIKYVTDYVFKVLLPIVRKGILLVDIGTVATGGMGMNLGFTHNEATHDGNIGPKLIDKNIAASVHGGLLDMMGRTPNFRVARVVPRGMIGFERPFYGPIVVDGSVPQMAVSQFLSKDSLRPVGFELDGEYVGVGGRMGENGVFGLEETVAITALGMMETVSAEAVAGAAFELMMRLLANGGTYLQHDLHPDPTSFAQRQRLVKEMIALSAAHQTHSVAFGNLGPYLTTELWELMVLRWLDFTPRKLAEGIPTELKVSQYGDVAGALVKLAGLGIPVMTDEFFMPARLDGAKRVTVAEIEDQIRRVDIAGKGRLWAVDLRRARLVSRWHEAAKVLMAADPNMHLRSHLPLSWDDNIRPGSFWAALATVTGHGRGDHSGGSRY